MNVDGLIRPPGDKSITHRALMLAALAPGRSRIVGALTGEDARSTASALRRLGVSVGPLTAGRPVRVQGGAWRAPEKEVDCGNSGTAARLLLGLLAGHAFTSRLTGDASLRRRPMARVVEPLGRMGAAVEYHAEDGRLPLSITGGGLGRLEHTQSVASAQVKSALLLAGVVAGVEVTVHEPVRSRDHTERMLTWLGYPVEVAERSVRLAPFPLIASARPAFELSVPGDISSAAFPVVAAVLAEAGELVVADVGTNPTRTGFLRVLERMGASIVEENPRMEGEEPVADLVVRAGRLRGTVVRSEEVPSLIDEVPVLAVAAARAEGETMFEGVEELRVKESDRLGLLTRNLRALGVEATSDGGTLRVAGTDRPLRGAVETDRDHRMTMAFAVLATVPDAEVTLSETASAEISYPGFFEDLERIGGTWRVV